MTYSKSIILYYHIFDGCGSLGLPGGGPNCRGLSGKSDGHASFRRGCVSDTSLRRQSLLCGDGMHEISKEEEEEHARCSPILGIVIPKFKRR